MYFKKQQVTQTPFPLKDLVRPRQLFLTRLVISASSTENLMSGMAGDTRRYWYLDTVTIILFSFKFCTISVKNI